MHPPSLVLWRPARVRSALGRAFYGGDRVVLEARFAILKLPPKNPPPPACCSTDARVVVIGATNRPQELDEAARRRFAKRIYIPLPDAAGRRDILHKLLAGDGGAAGPGGRAAVRHALSAADVQHVVSATDGYSGSDLTALTKEAAMLPVRRLGERIGSVALESIPPVAPADFAAALAVVRPSVDRKQLAALEAFTRDFGTV